jgi:hypothetical protein
MPNLPQHKVKNVLIIQHREEEPHQAQTAKDKDQNKTLKA